MRVHIDKTRGEHTLRSVDLRSGLRIRGQSSYKDNTAVTDSHVAPVPRGVRPVDDTRVPQDQVEPPCFNTECHAYFTVNFTVPSGSME